MKRDDLKRADWEPLGLERLREIVTGNAGDPPTQGYTPDEVYRMAYQLMRLLETAPPEMPRPVSPARAKKIALYLEYIAFVMRRG